jgi:hypothetical protein
LLSESLQSERSRCEGGSEGGRARPVLRPQADPKAAGQEGGGEETSLFAPDFILLKNPNICQDRLGTNTGRKLSKRRTFFWLLSQVIMEESYRQEAFSEADMMKRLPSAVVRNTPLFEPFKYQMHHFILPRRARDKHRENSKKEWRFSQRMEMETYSYHNLLTRVPLFREHLDEYFDPESRSMETKQNKAAMEVRTTTTIDAYLARVPSAFLFLLKCFKVRVHTESDRLPRQARD